MSLVERRIRSGINFKTPLRKSPRGAFEMNEITVDAVSDNIKNLLMTNFGERVIHYDLGAHLRPLIFENRGEDLRQKMSDSITSAVEKWLPFVTLSEITIEDSVGNASLRDNEVLIKLKFVITQTGLEGS